MCRSDKRADTRICTQSVLDLIWIRPFKMSDKHFTAQLMQKIVLTSDPSMCVRVWHSFQSKDLRFPNWRDYIKNGSWEPKGSITDRQLLEYLHKEVQHKMPFESVLQLALKSMLYDIFLN